MRILLGAVALLATAPASAAVILFSNFDAITSPDFATQGYTIIPTADGWTSTTSGIEIQNNNVAGTPFSSPNLVELDTFSNSSMFVTLAAGQYTVDYYYSPRPGVAANSNGIDLSIGATLLDSVTGTGANDTVWGLRSVTFNTTGGNLTFSATGVSDGYGGYLDNITISAVPEPATWGMLIAGFAMTGLSVRRRRAGVVAA